MAGPGGVAERSYRLTQRRACGALGAARSSVRYIGVRPPQEALRARIRELAAVRVSYGYPRLTVLLRREGWHVNKKRVYRLYREEGLVLRRKRPKRRRSAVRRQAPPAATRPNERWTMDCWGRFVGGWSSIIGRPPLGTAREKAPSR